MGWWVFGLIRVFDVIGDRGYFDLVIIIFDDFVSGFGGLCNGGVYWSWECKYVNVIINEFYFFIVVLFVNCIFFDFWYLVIVCN